jgi:hypothetical protein
MLEVLARFIYLIEGKSVPVKPTRRWAYITKSKSSLPKHTLSLSGIHEKTKRSISLTIKGVFGGEVACAFLSKKHVFIGFGGVICA